MPDEFPVRHVTEAAQLRALAHPLRQRLYEQLVLFGPLTATELAERVDDTPSNCSWHLRKLAAHGFAEEAPRGAGRQRPWQAATAGLRWQDDAGDEDVRRAGDALSRMMLERELQRLHDARQRLPTDDEAWREAAETTQSLLWLTAEELAAVNDEVRRLLLSTVDRLEHPDRRPPGSRLCAFLAWGVPTYDLADPTPAAPDAER
jgi:DNA-binding transcriptional ArsR family regulator